MSEKRPTDIEKRAFTNMNEWAKLGLHVGVSLIGSMLVAWGTLSRMAERVDTHTREIAETRVQVAAHATDISALKVSQATVTEKLGSIAADISEIKAILTREQEAARGRQP